MIGMLMAVALALPRMDVEAGCRVAGHGFVSAVNTCRAYEQDAYDRLAAVWSQLTPATRTFCVRLAGTGAPLPYQRLERCVAMTLPRQTAQDGRPFRY